MPVRLEINQGMLEVRQSFDFPAVYLDHWAVRRFSSKSDDGWRFLRALRPAVASLGVQMRRPVASGFAFSDGF